MTDKDKIELADYILNFVARNSQSEDMPIMVGTLNKPYGFNGFKRAEIGTPVFKHKGLYEIYFETINGTTAQKTVTMKFNQNIEPDINFIVN